MVDTLYKLLIDCFKSEKGKKPNLRKIVPNNRIVRVHLEKAHSNLKAMRLMFENDFFDWTVICGYYAMYHAVLASLINIGIRAYSHTCAIAAFQKFYVKRGKVEDEFIEYLQRAKRLEGKYVYRLREARENRVRVQYGICK